MSSVTARWRAWWQWRQVPVVSAQWIKDYHRTAERNGIDQSAIQQWPIVTELDHDRSATSSVSDGVGVAAVETLPGRRAGVGDVVSDVRPARGSG